MLLAIKIWFGFLTILLAVDLLVGQLFSTRLKQASLKQASLKQASLIGTKKKSPAVKAEKRTRTVVLKQVA